MTISISKELFWSKVDIRGPDECWEWKAGKNAKGYGQLQIDYTKQLAHRVAWEFTNGPTPEGKWILHKCDNPPCCNPKHLYAGTRDDNINDVRARHPELFGSGRAKFTSAKVLEIRKLKGTMSIRDAVYIYKVSCYAIWKIWTKDKFLCKEGHYV